MKMEKEAERAGEGGGGREVRRKKTGTLGSWRQTGRQKQKNKRTQTDRKSERERRGRGDKDFSKPYGT